MSPITEVPRLRSRLERYSLVIVGLFISAGFLGANTLVGFDADMSTLIAVGVVFFFSLFAQTLINAHSDMQFRLAESNRVLESRVSERTLDLTRINVQLTDEIHLRQEAERLLRASESRYRTIFENAGTAIMICDHQGQVLLANSQLHDMLGYTAEELRDSNGWMAFMEVGQQARILRWSVENHATGSSPRCFESALQCKNGENKHFYVTMATILGRPEVLVSLVDISELKQAERRLFHQAFHDPLTDLPNRALFMEVLDMTLRRSRRNRECLFSVLYLDIDRFKYVNDSMGHLFGDQLLVRFANAIKTCLRDSDTVARMGGDEFAVLLDNVQGLEYTDVVVERITTMLRKPLDINGHEIFCAVSMGIMADCRAYENADDIIRDADAAMYEAKSAGGDCCKMFEKRMYRRFKRVLELETAMRKALENEEFVLHYQPIVSMKCGGVSSFEALARWQRKGFGLTPPAEFIPVAEETGLILPLGRWVLAKACEQMSLWQKTYPALADCSVCVNLSGRQFKDPDLEEHIMQVLQDTGLSPKSLKLEITENEVMHNPERAIELLGRIRKLGIKIMVDDFGTGYSSLSYLHRFPIDVLKLDRNFVDRLDTSTVPSDRKIVEAIVALAHGLNLEVVAEGVERVAQREFLAKLNCQFAQGFLYYRPMPPEMIREGYLDKSSGKILMPPNTHHPSLISHHP
ncbi:putative bifunctional diguanylate cyclase/phosphodiesterase [Desulfonatronum thiosulfatophilum]|nr:EAL domain-containing protein [Desulfonatronum thiosulfatophilum]